MFVENVGQFDQGARFQANSELGTIYLTEDAVWITLLEKPSANGGKELFCVGPVKFNGEWEGKMVKIRKAFIYYILFEFMLFLSLTFL